MRIIPGQGVCDPHIHIFNGKAYMFSSHDSGRGNPDFRNYDWRIFSSDDLLNWNLEYTLRPEDTYIGKFNKCYATDAAEKNGKFYFYFSKDQESTGVAVSETGPAGPYRDALGKPLLPKGIADTPSYDPSVFVDDDGTPYIIWGYTCFGKKYYIARLNDDMISLSEDPREIEIINSWPSDAAWIWKHNGLYYMITHRSWYASAESIYGPYTFRGRFCFDADVDHSCIFDYHNQTYLAYSVPDNVGEQNVDPFYRTTKIIYAHYRKNGDLACDEFIQQHGVGHYDASWNLICGEWYFAASDGIVKEENGCGFHMSKIRDGSYLCFPNVSNVRQNALMFIRASNNSAAPCTVEIREGSPFGPMLGICTVKDAGHYHLNTFSDIPVRLENTYGTHSLCFVFRGSGSDILHFDGFRFEQIKP